MRPFFFLQRKNYFSQWHFYSFLYPYMSWKRNSMFHSKKWSRKQLFCSIWQVLSPDSSQAVSPKAPEGVQLWRPITIDRGEGTWWLFPHPALFSPKPFLALTATPSSGENAGFLCRKGLPAPPRDAVCWFPQSCDTLKSDFGQKDFVVNLQNSYTNVISCTK